MAGEEIIPREKMAELSQQTDEMDRIVWSIIDWAEGKAVEAQMYKEIANRLIEENNRLKWQAEVI